MRAAAVCVAEERSASSPAVDALSAQLEEEGREKAARIVALQEAVEAVTYPADLEDPVVLGVVVHLKEYKGVQEIHLVYLLLKEMQVEEDTVLLEQRTMVLVVVEVKEIEEVIKLQQQLLTL